MDASWVRAASSFACVESGAGAAADRRRARGGLLLQVGELPLEAQPPLLIPIDAVDERPHLQLDVLHGLDVRFGLGRQLAGVLPPVGLELLLVIDQPRPRLVQL